MAWALLCSRGYIEIEVGCLERPRLDRYGRDRDEAAIAPRRRPADLVVADAAGEAGDLDAVGLTSVTTAKQ
jgi:hypothetical protein